MTNAVPAAPPDTNNESQKRAVLLVSVFAAFLVPFLTSAINLALPSIGKDLHANAVPLSWVVSSFILSSAIFMLPFGRLGDITGRKRIFLLGIILFTVSTLLIIFSNSLASLLILRTAQGFSSAMIFGTSMAILTAVYPAGERGKALGLSVTATYVGLSAGPVIGGILTHYIGWRSIFALIFLIGLLCIYFVISKMKSEWADARGERFDWRGSLIYGIALFGFMYGFSKLPSVPGWIFVSAGIIAAGVFLFFERKVEHPVFDAKLFLTNRVLAFSGLAALINYSATSAIGFFMSLYLQNIKGLDARSAGLVMISQPLFMAALSPVAGRLSDTKNPGVIASFGMGITGAGLILFCFINDLTPIWLIACMLAMMGAGFALFSSPNSNAIMSSVEKKQLGIASSVVGTMRMIGQMMSMGIATMLISVYIGKQAISSATAHGLMSSMKTGFIIFSALSVVGVFASLARNRSAENMRKAS